VKKINVVSRVVCCIKTDLLCFVSVFKQTFLCVGSCQCIFNVMKGIDY
jgi:hypothetical protein